MPRAFIRLSAFFRKEILDVLRQPGLMLSLVIGPFLVLLVFGLGYRSQPPPFRTLFVEAAGGDLGEELAARTASSQSLLAFAGTTGDEPRARLLLREGEVDLVLVFPPDPVGAIRGGERAVFEVIHAEADPFQADLIAFAAQAFAEELNRELLRAALERGQGFTHTGEEALARAKESLAGMRSAVSADEEGALRHHKAVLLHEFEALAALLGPTIVLTEGVEASFQGNRRAAETDLGNRLSDLRDTVQRISTGQPRPEELRQLEEGLEDLGGRIEAVERLEPDVLVSPFQTETRGLGTLEQMSITSFYGPAVIALILQHLAVSFAALSLVREEQLGITELFRAAPLRPVEMLIGKHLGLSVLAGGLTGALAAAFVLGIGVPVVGGWTAFASLFAALLFASLALGFLLSVVAETDHQAVQYVMLVLLVSIFFSGLFLSRDMLAGVADWTAAVVPATYGIEGLRGLMLLGREPAWHSYAVLIGMGVLFSSAAWMLLRRRVRLT